MPRNLQRYAVIAFIIIMPIIYPIVGNGDIREFQEKAFRFLGMGLASLFINNIWMSLMFIHMLLLDFLNGREPTAQAAILNCFIGLILFGISRNYFKRHGVKATMRYLLWPALASMLFMVLQLAGVDPFNTFNNPDLVDKEVFRDPIGLMGIKAHNGIFLSLLIPILMQVHPLLGALMFIPIGLSICSAAALSAISAFMFTLWFMRRKWCYVLLPILMICGVYYGIYDYKSDPDMYRSRFNTWHATVKYAALRPIGWGIDSYRNFTNHKTFKFYGDDSRRSMILFTIPQSPDSARLMYYHPNQLEQNKLNSMMKPDTVNFNIWDNPHNEYLYILFCLGIPGFFFFCMLLRECVIRFIKSDKTKELVMVTSMLIVYGTAGLTQFPLSVARLAFLAPILLGAFFSLTDKSYAPADS